MTTLDTTIRDDHGGAEGREVISLPEMRIKIGKGRVKTDPAFFFSKDFYA